MKSRKIKRWREGFTLAETLAAVLIMLMVSAVVAAGIPAARTAYENVVLASNAEVLLSTTISALRNELGTAKDISLASSGGEDGNTEIRYYHRDHGAVSKISLAGDSEEVPVILCQRYADGGVENIEGSTARLISREAATGDLYPTYDSVEYDEENGLITFNGLQINRESGRTGLAGRETVSIRVFSY